jgi:hypothetical protein
MIKIDQQQFQNIIPMIKSADINTLFALAVLEKKVDGNVFVDDKNSPTAFYIQHSYGMSLLFGETSNEEFYTNITSNLLNRKKERWNYEWLQV